MSSRSKLWKLIDNRVKVTIADKRRLIGTLKSFDKHLNLILADTIEERTVKSKTKGTSRRIIKRPLGLLILRGDQVVSVTAN